MSYTPTEWNDNDAVTSAKLNHLESGVTAVGYEPTTWQVGDVVTAEKLNKLEQGVADSADTMANYVNRTMTEFTITEDMKRYGRLSISAMFNFSECENLEKINGLDLINSFVGSPGFVSTKKLKEIYLLNATSVGGSYDPDGTSLIASSGVERFSAPKATESYSQKSTLSGANELQYLYLPSVNQMPKTQGSPKLKHVYIGKDCTSIDPGCFGGSGTQSTGLIIDCGFAEGSVSGAPWAASNATINYNVPDPGSIEAMIEGESDN